MSNRWIVAALVLVLAVTLVACGRDAGVKPEPVVEEPIGTDGGPSSTMLAGPGIYETDEGVQVLGTLKYVDLEGGYWVLVDNTPSGGGGNVAVLVGAEDLGVDLKAIEGRYCGADGSRLEGASIRNAGPEVQVTKIYEIGPDMVVEPEGDAAE